MVSPKNKNEMGQGLIEYVLLIVLLAIVLIVALNFLAPRIRTYYTHISGIMAGIDDDGMCEGYHYYLELPDGSIDISGAGDRYSKTSGGYCWMPDPDYNTP